ncbi:hypothetical protein P8850_19465 [Bacillus inaquosorum]|nr:hypothetical protein [Bacillus inaquosorum]MED3669593.1 hypothetical protein [Bacillus subtilis]MCY8725528.1 hypothetical protein [Bacillus inaquosorum]MCY9382766.1 hypothetical protein [Bacillus inaquosorum]MEC0538885.1 hypothetical protein [Bacillus inaquosorum]MEC0639963.1 hypothetical protein [Bacillus inaquosorum]
MGMKEKTNIKATDGLYIFGPLSPTEGNDLTPTIRLLEEKIKQMERMLSA